MNRTVTRTRSSVIHEEGAVGIDVGEAIGPGPISVGKIRPPQLIGLMGPISDV